MPSIFDIAASAGHVLILVVPTAITMNAMRLQRYPPATIADVESLKFSGTLGTVIGRHHGHGVWNPRGPCMLLRAALYRMGEEAIDALVGLGPGTPAETEAWTKRRAARPRTS